MSGMQQACLVGAIGWKLSHDLPLVQDQDTVTDLKGTVRLQIGCLAQHATVDEIARSGYVSGFI